AMNSVSSVEWFAEVVRRVATPTPSRTRVEAVQDETGDTRTLTLRPGRGWRGHRPGQHVRVTVAINGRLATRTYSISSAPDARCFTITVKAQGRVSTYLVRDVSVGSHLTIGAPEGDFVLPDDVPEKIAFITAGSGITPIMSMLRTLAARGELADVVHVHYARGEVIFGDELRALAASHPGYRLAIVDTREDRRRFSAMRLAEWVPDWRERETWACGPQGLMDSIERCFDGVGTLHVERFTAALAPIPANEHGGTVRFKSSRTERTSDGRTPLLRIAEDAGVSAPHGCRMGICHTCDATLLSGRVRDLRTGETITEPGARVQVCVCSAAGDVELAL
ncbi:MAG TPA: ferredoxin reductase, partial [Kofleriaceae bacterium]